MAYDFISIGIITKDGADVIGNTLYYLLQQTYPLEYVEIIIVDGNSKDNTKEVVDHMLLHKVRYTFVNESSIKNIKGVNYGHSWARNVAIMHVDKKSNYIAWIDGDCRPEKNRLEELRKHLKKEIHNKTIVGAGGFRSVEYIGDIPTKELVINNYFTSYIMTLGNPAFCKRNVTFLPSVAGYNSIYRKEILEQYMYDTTYPFNTDDIEINHRITKDGGKFLYVPTAKIWHRHTDSIVAFLKQLFTYGKGVGNVMKLHKDMVRLYVPLSLMYLFYIIVSPFLLLFFQCYFGLGYVFVIPYGLLFLLTLAVFIENLYKTKSLKSFRVFVLVPSHLAVYGRGVIYSLLSLGGKKK